MLNNFNPQHFLSHYWQKAACVITNAFDSPIDYISADELAGLSLEDEIESRIIQNNNGQWTLSHGPFDESTYQHLSESNWTLLVQTADHWLPELAEFLDNFRFIPRWRFDDVMISFATQGGGVGPHFDNYDVFIVQAEGERHWRVGKKGDTQATQSLVNDLLHLESFEPIIDVILKPGDILYIPPDTAHWGIARNDSISYSVGFRAPQTRDLLALLAEHLESSNLNRFFSDEYRNKPNCDSKIEPELIQWAQNEIVNISSNQQLITELLSKFLSRSKLEEIQNEDKVVSSDLSKISKIGLHKHFNYNWYLTDKSVVLSIANESFKFPLNHLESVKSLANGEHIQINSNKYGDAEVAFYQTLARMLERGYFLYS